MQMGFAAMLVDADHTALEVGNHVLNRAGVDYALAASSLITLSGGSFIVHLLRRVGFAVCC